MSLTIRSLQKLAKSPNTAMSEKLGKRGAGVLEFRALPSGEIAAAFRYAAHGTRERIPLGAWQESSIERSLQALRRRAQVLAQRLQDGKPPREEVAGGTLSDLLSDYVASLKNPGTSRAVKNLFARTIPAKYLRMPAAAISGEHVLLWLKAKVTAGVQRDTNKFRSYLHSAFNLPIKAAGNPVAAQAVTRAYGLKSNPVALTRRVAAFDKAGDRVLTDDELRVLWVRIAGADIDVRRAVHLALRLGGQRMEQMLRATMDQGAVRILDAKGRRDEPRVHMLPVPLAAAALVAGYGDGEPLFDVSVDHVRRVVNRIGKRNGGWHLADLRRTCETRLAELGVSQDMRARIQSHGISGVQERHYCRADWLPQLAVALGTWNTSLDSVVSAKPIENIVQLRKSANS